MLKGDLFRYIPTTRGIILTLFLFSCKQKSNPGGEAMINYPDLPMILQEHLKPYQKDPYTFKLLERNEKGIDSTFLKASQIDWADWEEPFLEANLYDKKLDGHYDLDVLHDTLLGKMTMLFTALDPKDLTSRLSISARASDHKILSMYIETRDPGLLITREYKLLFVPGKSLQIQETSKYPFLKPKKRIRTLQLLN